MAGVFGILGGLIFLAVASHFYESIRKRREDREMEEEINEAMRAQEANQEMRMQEVNQEARNETTEAVASDLIFQALNSIGCQPKFNDDKTLSVQYQGEDFLIDFGGERYARIWDPFWAGVRADDPELPKLREAVNAANYNFGPKVLMSEPDKDGVISFHSRYDLMLDPAIPEIPLYVQASLNMFFTIKEDVRISYQKLDARQSEAAKQRRPVGFASPNE